MEKARRASLHSLLSQGPKFPRVRFMHTLPSPNSTLRDDTGYVVVIVVIILHAFVKPSTDKSQILKWRMIERQVISICLKEGASEKGLKGMKEVANGYIKSERVGFAHLSPGVDVYLCPRSDAIITILAKYGFFKGMAAVEGKSELMIGCVIWRKNRTALTSVAKKSEDKANVLQEQLQKSPSDSSTSQGGGQGSLSVPAVKNSNPPAPFSSLSTLEQANVTDDKSIDIDSASRTTFTASAVKSPALQQKESELSSSHLWGSKGHLPGSEASCVHQSNAEPPKETMDLPKPVTSLLPNASKRKMAFSDDDDLPEFDFGTASGISSSSHRSDRSILGNWLQLSGSRNLDMSKQPTRPAAPSVSTSVPRSVISVSQGMPLARNVNDHGQLVNASRQMEEKTSSQSHPIPVAMTVCTSGSLMVPFDSSGKKNLFCDDDMPEWFPPDVQNKRTNEPPTILHRESSDQTSRMLPPLPTGPVFPYPSSATIHNSFSVQPSPPLHHLPANSKVPPPIPSQDGPSYLTGFTFNPVPTPHSNSLAASSVLHPADKRGMAAVEGNSQLIIGCVVWRKSRTALTSVAKKSEDKANVLQEQLQKSSSDYSTLQGGSQVSSSVPSVENSNPSAPLSSLSTLEQANVTDDKNFFFFFINWLLMTRILVLIPQGGQP
ncbi:putative protein starmaker-like [Capsicum annuum]|nr:putative protein starmaker-like [Capsicum annuum]